MVDRVLQGLARLRARDVAPLSQGLHPDNARACLDAAVDAITEDGLAAELCTPGVRPGDVTLVAAAGVGDGVQQRRVQGPQSPRSHRQKRTQV